MTKKYLITLIGIIVLAVILFALIGRLPPKVTFQTSVLEVSTSFYPLYFFTTEVTGTKASVKNITPPGAEPHDYEPTPSDIATIERSRLIVLNGGHLEVWGNAIQKNVDPVKTSVIVAGEGLTTATLVEDGKTITDPHVWLSPPLAIEMTDKILNGLIAVDMPNKDYYVQHASELKAKLGALDQEYRTGLASCERKDFVTSHAAFGYLASTYGLTQVPIAGLSPDTEPSPKQLGDIVNFVHEQHISVIFFESLVSPKLAQTIAQETNAKTLVLDPLEGLTPEDVAADKNYFTVMHENLQNLRIALSCK